MCSSQARHISHSNSIYNHADSRIHDDFARERVEKVISWAYHMHHLRHIMVRQAIFWIKYSKIETIDIQVAGDDDALPCCVCVFASARDKTIKLLEYKSVRRFPSLFSSHFSIVDVELWRVLWSALCILKFISHRVYYSFASANATTHFSMCSVAVCRMDLNLLQLVIFFHYWTCRLYAWWKRKSARPFR